VFEKKIPALLSMSTINQQPKKMTPRILTVMMMDLAGRKSGDIAKELGVTREAVTAIKASPMYKRRRAEEQDRLKESFVDKQADRLMFDPVAKFYREHALDAAKEHVNIMNDGRSEFARLQAADRVVENSGYKATMQSSTPEIKLEEKFAIRFEKVMVSATKYASNNDGSAAEDNSEAVSP
jgi:hypothetical protein